MNSECQNNQISLKKLVDDANSIILYLDQKQSICLCNKKTEKISGKNKSELIGNSWDEIFSNDSNADKKQQIFKAVLDDTITNKRSSIFESSIVDSLKIEHIISWNITPIFDISGTLEGILLLGSDVSSLKEREASLKKIDDTLMDMLSSIKEYALYAINLKGNITYCGMGFEPVFGWQKSEIAFKHVGLLHTIEDAANKLNYILEQTREKGYHEQEIFLVRKNGQTFPAILTIHRFLDADGALVGYIFIAKDVTEEKRLESQIFQSEKMSAVGKLAAGMAHEINNPLFVISGRLLMLLDSKRLATGVRNDLKIINGQAERIRSLVDRFLTFARKTSPNQEILEVNKIINSVLPLVSYHKLPSHKLRIVKDFTKKLPSIRGDLHQLQEVFLNLFINACQAMPQGGTLAIKTANIGNEFAQISITDTGDGISPENLRNLFIPFFSTKKEGTGLGLSICYNIIKNHRGSIEVESGIPKGTTFNVKLPFIKKGE